MSCHRLVSRFSLLAVVALTLARPEAAQADSFIKPPETYAPVWFTSFPYQRNINLDFAINPVGSPGGGIPGAVYEGWLDPTLKSSDFVTLSGAVSWYSSPSGITQTGLLGIDNRTGGSLLTGTAAFHIDNTTAANAFKNIWVESVALTGYSGANAWLSVSDALGNPATFIGGPGAEPYGDEWLSNYEFRITPNPLYETILWEFEVPAGTYIFLDSVHVATECIPEPGTLGLLALGTLALLCRRAQRA